MSIFDDRRAHREKIDQIEKDLVAAKAEADKREPRVNALLAWLNARRVSNGIGHDFEWTLQHPRGAGGQ